MRKQKQQLVLCALAQPPPAHLSGRVEADQDEHSCAQVQVCSIPIEPARLHALMQKGVDCADKGRHGMLRIEIQLDILALQQATAYGALFLETWMYTSKNPRVAYHSAIYMSRH